MATIERRSPLNVAGKFYIDDTCIDCDLCRQIAPNVFRRDDESGASYAYRQPLNADDLAAAEEAVSSCPTESVGNDG